MPSKFAAQETGFPMSIGVSNNGSTKSKRFGSFSGVFTPNVLTILGVILFLRAGWVVGNAGILGAVLVIVVSHLISLSTGLSLSAIATSMDVKAGGNYYMISRTLGLEIGGSIGIPLYLSQALSIAFYIIGFTEGLRWAFPQLDPLVTASLTCIILFSIGISGADWTIKVQYFILAVLGLSLVSFFTVGQVRSILLSSGIRVVVVSGRYLPYSSRR